MSSIEQALRAVERQRQETLAPPAMPPIEMLDHDSHAPGRGYGKLALGLVVAFVLMGAGASIAWVGWLPADLLPAALLPAGARGPAATPAVSAPPTAQEPVSPSPEAVQAQLPATPTAPFQAWDWPPEPNRFWTSGQHVKAALAWLDLLRSQPPSTTAFLLAERQTLPQARQWQKEWASQLPVVVLAAGNANDGAWMVLAIPVPAEVDRARDLLKETLGRAPAWGSLSHWIGNLEAGRTSPAAPATTAPSTAAVAPATLAKVPMAAPVGLVPPPAPATATPPLPPAEAPGSGVSTASESTTAASSRAIEAYFQSIERLLARGDYANARNALARLEQYAGQTWRTHYLNGVALSGLGRWEEASATLVQAHARNPGHPLVAVYLSVALQERGDHAQALRALAPALEQNPAVPELWLNQGVSLQASGQLGEANQAYQRFLELSAGRADLQAQRTWAQARIQGAR